jgi:hypothetical protein
MTQAAPFRPTNEYPLSAVPTTGAGLDEDDPQAILTHMIQQARDFIDTVGEERARATKLYHAEPVEKLAIIQGRSGVIVPTVRNVVRGAKPDIVRVVFGADRPVAVEPWKPGTEKQAEQATDFLRLTIEHDNDGERILGDVIDDGLIRKLGVVKWWWDDTSKVTTHKQRLTQEQFAFLQQQDPTIEITDVGDDADAQGAVTITYTSGAKKGVARFEALPGEQFLFDSEARTIESARFVAHRCEKSRGELLAMGVSEADIDQYGGTAASEDDNAEKQARNDYHEDGEVEEGTNNQRILYIEAYPFLRNAKGEDELRRVICLGPGYTIIENEPCDERPFAAWTPVPEAHLLMGYSYADLVENMMYAETSVLRASLDSLAASIFPRTVYKDGDANLKDLLNTAIGAPIRAKSGPQAVSSFSHNFVGKEALPFLSLFRELTERSTGQAYGAQGMDADALQSSTADAVAASVQGAKMQSEMTARLFISGVLKPLMRGLYRLYIKHQPAERLMRVRGQWVPINPSQWDADAEVRVLTPLGAGLVSQRLETLMLVKETQEQILQQLGPVNPLVKASQYWYTLSQLLKLRGFVTPQLFFTEPDDAAIEQAARAAAEQQPAQDPAAAALMAQVEVEKAKAQHTAQLKELEFQRDSQLKQMDLAFKEREAQLSAQAAEREYELARLKIMLEDDRARDKQASEAQLKQLELELAHKAEIDNNQLRAEVQRERATNQAGPSGE